LKGLITCRLVGIIEGEGEPGELRAVQRRFRRRGPKRDNEHLRALQAKVENFLVDDDLMENPELEAPRKRAV
jgi:hypothetical protein